MSAVAIDMRYTLRSLLQNPGYAAAVILTLSLGIGVNCLIFSLVYAVLFRPLPGYETNRIVLIYEQDKDSATNKVSPPVIQEWRQYAQSFTQIEATQIFPMTVTGTGLPEAVNASLVTANYFSLYGEKAALGRTFLPEEDKVGSQSVVLLDYNFWRRRFGEDPGIVGRVITLDGKPYTVVGVAPKDFSTYTRGQVAVYVPVVLDQYPADSFWVVARLKPEVSLAGARAEMDVLSKRLETVDPNNNKDLRANVVSFLEVQAGTAQIKPTLMVLAAAVSMILLIACTNVASLILARNVDRQTEFSIRTVLGAGPFQLARQMAMESLLLSFLGGALGLVLAAGGLRLLERFQPKGISRLDEFHLDTSVLVTVLVFSLIAAVLCSLSPIYTVVRQSIQKGLQQQTRGNSAGKSRSFGQKALIVSEVALAYILVLAAVTLVDAFRRLQRTDVGYDPDNVLTFSLSVPPSPDPQGQAMLGFFTAVAERLRRLPGVRSVGITSALPTGGLGINQDVQIVGRPLPPNQQVTASLLVVDSNYFQTLRIPALRGRSFSSQDSSGAQPIALINRALAERCFHDIDPLGQRLSIFKLDPNLQQVFGMTEREIVGIVEDTKNTPIPGQLAPEVYVPLAQSPIRSVYVALRTSQKPATLTSAVAEEVANQDKNIAITDAQSMTQRLEQMISQPRDSMQFFTFFAVLALALSEVGIYGLLTYLARGRTNEIGIRIALGATPRTIFAMVGRQAAVLALSGIAIGACISAAFNKFLGSQLYGLDTRQPLIAPAVALLLFIGAFIATCLPARRATKVDPALALRGE